MTRRSALANLGVAPPFDGLTIQRLAAAHPQRDGPLMNSLISYISNADIEAAWEQLITAVAYLTDEDQLSVLGLTAVEGFIQEHPEYALSRLDDVRNIPGSRKAASSAFAFAEAPPGVEEALDEFRDKPHGPHG